MRLRLRFLVLCALLAGCYHSRRIVDDGDGDGAWTPVQRLALPVPAANGVDLLFVVDNSNSMNQEQQVLAEQIVVMLQDLLDPSDASAPLVDDLHLGIVTTDMGTGGYTIQTCSNPMSGDNGVLQNRGRLERCASSYSAPGCDRAECPWLEHSAAYPDVGADPSNPPIWDDFGCVATLGTGGCGFEQQLEASYQALVVQTEAGMPNEGFLRPDSALVVIYVTDEDDCSTPNMEMFNPNRDDFGSLNVRCVLQRDELYPIERYHDAFVELRGGNAARVAVAAITGVPVDGSWDPGDPIEELREMQVVDPTNPSELMKSCDTPMGVAFPPVRIAELVYSFGRNGVLASICREDWTPALQVIAQAIQDILPSSCLHPGVPFDPDRCRVMATLRNGDPCPSSASADGPERTSGALVDEGLDDYSRRVCEVLPADYDRDGCPDGASTCTGVEFPDGLQGWFFSPATAGCPDGEIRLTGTGIMPQAIELWLECLADQ